MSAPSAKRPFWQRTTVPLQLLYRMIWQPSHAAGVPLLHVVLLLLVCSLPLVVGVAQAGGAIGWLVVLLGWCIAAGLALSGVAKEGSALLLVAGVVALARPPRLVTGVGEVFRFPSAGGLIGALLICGVLLAFVIGIGTLLGRLPWRWPAYGFATCGGNVVALLALIITDQDESITALALLLFGLALLPLAFGAVDGVLFCFTLLGFIFAVFGTVAVESRVLVPFAGLVGFLFAYLLRPVLQACFEWSVGAAPREATLGVVRRATAPLIAVLLIVIAVLGGLLVAGISVLPPPLFLLVCWFAGLVGFGPYETDWKNMLLLLLVPAIGVETQGLATTALGLLAVLVGSYRLLPEYAIFTVVSLCGRRAPAEHAGRWLRRLPPWSSEHLWLPLPGHAALLHTALESGSATAFGAVQLMRDLAQPGFARTLLVALPPFVRTQLLQVQTPQQIAALAGGQTALVIGALVQAAGRQGIGRNSNEPIMRIRLRPAAELPWERRRRRTSPLAIDVALVLPGLQRIAQTVAEALAPPTDPRALTISHAWFDLRSLPSEETIKEYTSITPPQPTLGDALAALGHLVAGLADDADATARWQPVIMQWRAVLQSRVEE